MFERKTNFVVLKTLFRMIGKLIYYIVFIDGAICSICWNGHKLVNRRVYIIKKNRFEQTLLDPYQTFVHHCQYAIGSMLVLSNYRVVLGKVVP